MSEELQFGPEPEKKEDPLVYDSVVIVDDFRETAERIRHRKHDAGLIPLEKDFLELYDSAVMIAETARYPDRLTEEVAMRLYVTTLKIGEASLADYGRELLGVHGYTKAGLDDIDEAFNENQDITVEGAIKIGKARKD